MTESITVAEKINRKSGTKRSSLLVKLLWLLLVVLVLIVATGAWLTMTDSGAQSSLPMLGRLTGLQFQGISGNLIDTLRIRRIDMREKNIEFSADDVELRWQPRSLIRRQIQLDYLRVNNLELALAPGDGQPATLPKSLQLPDSIKLVRAQSVEVRQFVLSDLAANRQHIHPIQFSALEGSIEINPSQYLVQLQGTTPWGNAKLHGDLGSVHPFDIRAQIGWTGLAIHEADKTFPMTSLTGQVSGNLSRMALQAQLDATQSDPDIKLKSTQTARQTGGRIDAILTPFSALPIDTLKLDFVGVNPAGFYKTAPKACLHLKADFQVSGNNKAPVLSGHLSMENSTPATWNSGGVPVAKLNADMALSEHEVSWLKARIDLEQGGYALGEGRYIFPGAGTTLAAGRIAVPDLSAQFDVSNVDLLRIDSRLKKTRLSGSVSAKSQNQELKIGLNLKENNPALDAHLQGEISLNDQLTLTVQKMLLNAKDASVAASGAISLRESHAFHLAGEAHNFDPARWIAVPNGRIATHFNVSGQLEPDWRIEAQVSELSGQFAGLDLHGESDLFAQQNHLLSIKKLELSWGKSHLSAQGNWQLQEHLNLAQHEELQFVLAIPDLSALSQPFAKIAPIALQGSIFADGKLSGNAAEPSGTLNIKASQLGIPDVIYLDALQAHVVLEEGVQAKIDGAVTASGIATSASNNADTGRFKVQDLQASIAGFRHAHTVQMNATLPQQQQITLRAEGDLQVANANSQTGMLWIGRILALNLTGPLDFQLQSPFSLALSSSSAQMGEANWLGKLGKLHVQQLDWMHGQVNTSGQFQDIPVAKVMKMWRNDSPVAGKLLLDAAWQVDVGERVSGQLQVQRSSGDLTVQDAVNGHSQSIALGLQNLVFTATLGDHDASSQNGRQQISITAQAKGDQLGSINLSLLTYLNKTDQSWHLADNAPLSGNATLQVNDIGWMSQLMGPGMSVRGELDVDAHLNGVVGNPQYQAKINGKELQLVFSELGIVFPHGVLDASISGNQLTLNTLKFTESIKPPPKHDNLTDLGWLNETGYIESTGQVDLNTGRGALSTKWQKFPLMQNPEAWLVASGQAQLAESEKTWNLTGQLVADAAYFSVPKQAAPRLSSDVVVLKSNAKRSGEKSVGLQSSLDFSIGTGKNFVFVGRGIDTRLDGDIRIRSKNGGSILATGSIQTVGGTYEGYGQKLAIDRGILNFQGAIDNPGLNVRAMRLGLPVEAGVEVDGTVARPTVHLISEPNVPDPDKLSWMVLGRPSDQMAGSEATLLMSAAGAIFGGDNGSNIPGNIAHSLGLEDMTFGTTSTSPESQLPTQTVAGTINSTAPNDQVFSVGKRIAPNIVFSIERSLTDASNGLKLTWHLTRRFSIIGRAGSDTAIDGQYTISFD